MKTVYGKNTEANPRYREAVRRQQELESLHAEVKLQQPDRRCFGTIQEAERVQISRETAVASRRTALEASYVDDRPSIKAIVAIHAYKNALHPGELTGRSRKPAIVHIRHEAIVEAYQRRPDITIDVIATTFGYQSRKSMVYALAQRGIYLKPRKKCTG